MERGAVIMIATSQAFIPLTAEPTGVWLEDLAAAYMAFDAAGLHISMASPDGGPVCFEPASLSDGLISTRGRRFLASAQARSLLAESLPLSQVRVDDSVQAVWFAGGRGALWDFANNAAISRCLRSSLDAGVVIATIGCGVAALLNDAKPHWLNGRRLTGCAPEEDVRAGTDAYAPVALSAALLDQGAHFVCAPAFTPHVVSDRGLITAQNSASAALAADAVLALKRHQVIEAA
ncbi:type 1 glutamine amidotransferase family protein [Piscinibacter terrae]|nr:DJ-1/PfpI family protein [Albitalea terrae]